MAQLGLRAFASASILFTVVAASPQTPRDAATPAPAAGTASIHGRMTIATATGVAPVRRARVTLEGAALREAAVTDTDTDGRFHFDRLPAGAYRVMGDKAGFTPALRDLRRAFEKPPLFDVAAGQSVTHDLPMQRGAAIEGQLLRDNGEPAINIPVSAVRMGYSDIGRTPYAVRQVRTNDVGRFRIHSLPPGDYLVDAAPDPIEAANQIRTPGPRLPSLARTYYPGSPRLDDGRVVTVAAGQDVGSIDFTMTTMTTGSLSGNVVNAQGQPLRGASVRIQRVGGPLGEVRGFSSIEANTFDYAIVPPGEFWVTAVGRAAPGAEPEFAAQRFRAEGVEVKNYQVTTQPGVTLGGRVDGPGRPAGLRVAAVETAYQLPAMQGESPFAWVEPVGSDGTFQFKSLFGPRLFRVQGLPDTWALKGVWAGEQEISDTPVDINAAAAPGAIRIVVTSDTGALSGVVRDAKGVPVAGARVVVFGEDERAWGPRSRVIKTVETGADGRYEVRGVLEGKYAIVAVPFLDDGAWFDTGVLQQLKRNASTLAVTPGKHTLDLVVKP
ncbi:MAG: carboxypeptidase regulatory-like domain-containing protein [Acidobacteria bacterium]|nr:MAG: carboxypeptidase regulatory-like domain-containing protein [Acidobacteriota bacterium]